MWPFLTKQLHASDCAPPPETLRNAEKLAQDFAQRERTDVQRPLQTEPLSSTEPPVLADPGEKQREALRVLVVDDNRDAAVSLAMLVEVWGHTVHTACDGPGALAEARIFRPNVVLLDIGLPGMDGYEVARRLRGPDCSANVLLVAVTGYGQDEDRRRSQEAGFALHLVKPVEPGLLREILQAPKP